MVEFLKQILSDDAGQGSTARLMSLIALLAAIGMMAVRAAMGPAAVDAAHITYLFAGAFGMKLGQKYMEKSRNPGKKPPVRRARNKAEDAS